MISFIAVEAGREWSCEHPSVSVPFEQPGRHGRSRSDQSRVGEPPSGPRRTQALSGKEKIGSDGAFVVPGIARGMALQARRRGAGEQLARHLLFRRGDWIELLRNIRLRLARHGLKE